MQTKEKILEAKNSKEEPQNRKPKLFGSFFAISAFTSALVGYFAFASMECLKSCESQSKVLQLSYWPHVIDEWNVNGNLRTMKRVFDRLGYKMVNGSVGESWDLLWSIESLFDITPNILKDLEPHQKVNHFPAISFITHKMHLAITTDSKYIPKAFDLPRVKNEFLYFHKTYPNKKFVVKNYDNRGVEVVPIEEIDYFLGQERFIQEFISNPLLIDGHAFDMGVYVLITSMDPLRIYRWKSNVFLRFCPEIYHPFDPKNTAKYVVDERHIPYWEMPSLMAAVNQYNFSALKAFEFHLNEREFNVESLWTQVDDAINSITLSKVHQIYRYVEKFRKENPLAQNGCFELLRFDFIIDDTFKLHLMEINMSPNLTPAIDRNERLSLMYEQLVYNTLSIVGASTYNEVKPVSIEAAQMLSAFTDITVSPDVCLKCVGKCDGECSLCLPCLSIFSRSHFLAAYREHQRRGEMLRIFPSGNYATEKFLKQFSGADQLSVKWFKGKCELDDDWC